MFGKLPRREALLNLCTRLKFRSSWKEMWEGSRLLELMPKQLNDWFYEISQWRGSEFHHAKTIYFNRCTEVVVTRLLRLYMMQSAL